MHLHRKILLILSETESHFHYIREVFHFFFIGKKMTGGLLSRSVPKKGFLQLIFDLGTFSTVFAFARRKGAVSAFDVTKVTDTEDVNS